MHRLIAAVALALAASASHATLIGTADVGPGILSFYDEPGVCVAPAMKAVFKSHDGKIEVPGCWVARGPVITIAFLDGDAGQLPTAMVRRAL